jgi:DNA polymerase III subunit delta'
MLIGHEKQLRLLKQSAEKGRLSHAYLFAGPEKVGKKMAALEFASFLFKGELKNNQHPDLILVEPDPESGEIKIAQVRDLIWKLSLKPYSAPLKVAIINLAQTMNQESQNCFLKTLEEPKKDTILILVSEYTRSLLPTIISRCQIINFQPLPRKEIEKFLLEKGLDPEKIKEISSISLGRPGRAIDFLDSQKLDEFKKNMKTAAGLVGSDFSQRFQYAKEISQKDNLKEILETWLFYFRNLLLEKYLSSALDVGRILNVLKKIQETNSLISNTNVNSRLALEILMLEL